MDSTLGTNYAAARDGDLEARAWLVALFGKKLENRLSRKAGQAVRRWNHTDDLSQSVWTTFFERLCTYPDDLGQDDLKRILTRRQRGLPE